MPANATATLTVKLRDLVSGPARGINQSVGKIKESFGKLRGGFDLAGHVGFAASAVNQLGQQSRAALTSVLEPALRFEDTMARVGALTRGSTSADVAALTEKARQLGRDTRFMAEESARGFEQLAIAGFDAKQQLAAIDPVLKLTQASGADMGRVADITSDLIGSFGKTAADTGQVTGVLAATFTNSTTTLETLFETFKLAAPLATKAQIPMQQLAILTGLLGNAGLKGSIGGTALRGVLLSLVAPTKKATTALKRLGLSSKDIEYNLKNPAILIKRMADAFEAKGFSEPKQLKILNAIFGRRQAAGAAVLLEQVNKIGVGGRTAFESLAEGVYEGEDALNRIAATMDSTRLASIRKLNSAVESLKLDLAQELAPVFGPLITDLTKTVGKIAEWARANPELTTTLGKILIGVTAFSAVFGPLLLTLSSLISAFTVFRGLLITVRIPMAALDTMSKTLGTTMKTQTGVVKGMTGAMKLLTDAAGLVSAGFVGWQVGKVLDSAIGKVFKLREGLLSIELAHKAGESSAFNQFIGDIGETYGIQSLVDAAKGNQAVTDTMRQGKIADALAMINQAESGGLSGIDVDKAERELYGTGESDYIGIMDAIRNPQAPEAKGKVVVEIEDKRTRVRQVESDGWMDVEAGLNYSMP